MRRVAILGAVIALMMLGTTGRAFGQDGSDNANGTDPWTDVTSYQAFSPTCSSSHIYRTINGISLCTDVYQPTQSGSVSAIVLVHGGGWRHGGRQGVASEAQTTTGAGYLSFAIDYRLSCTNTSNPLCGYHAPDPVTDVAAAVAWVRLNAATFLQAGQTFSGKVYLLGFSAGGNLALMVAAHGDGSTGSQIPDAVAAWSGATELGARTSDNLAGCDGSDDASHCRSASKQYVDASTTCKVVPCDPKYAAASPWTVLDGTSQSPPTFIANSELELIPLVQATDYRDLLVAKQIPNRFCEVLIDHVHATGYENEHCHFPADAPGTVFDWTLTFFAGY